MNVPIVDPLQGDFPEVIEEFLQHGNMKCIAFNRRGTLLAAGCADGSCVIWDFETRGIAKELRDKDCIAPITSVCWSKYGHYLLASAIDKSLTLWDVVNGEKIAKITLQQTTLHARLHPGSSSPTVCLACPLSSAPILVDLNTGSSTVLPVLVSDTGAGNGPVPRNKFADGSPPFTPTAATFNKYGDLIYVGNSKGEILIVGSKNIQVLAIIPISGGSVIKNIVFSRNGQYLLTNSNDRVIRVYENLLPLKGAVGHLEKIVNDTDELQRTEKLKEVGSKCLLLVRELQDSVTRMHWKAPCFSGDGEWVVGASASKGEHKIYIWDRAGHLVKILEGPKEALTDLSWHPVRPLVVSVSITGWVYIWAKDYTENWSAFAPDFKELEENEEYVEREDEFDLMPETEKVKEVNIHEDEDVDIMTVEKDSALSDSDDAHDELCYLPAIPSPDKPEPPEKGLGSSSKLDDSARSASPFSEETGQDGQAIIPASSPAEAGNSAAEDANGFDGSKRKRKPTVKGLELQSEKGNKKPPNPISKKKPTGNGLKSRNVLSDTNGSISDDNGDDDDDDDVFL